MLMHVPFFRFFFLFDGSISETYRDVDRWISDLTRMTYLLVRTSGRKVEPFWCHLALQVLIDIWSNNNNRL